MAEVDVHYVVYRIHCYRGALSSQMFEIAGVPKLQMVVKTFKALNLKVDYVYGAPAK